MDRFDNIITNRNVTTGLFLSDDVAEVNMLRRAILNEVETIAIKLVVFYTNISARHDEILALRLGQLAIDNEEFIRTNNLEQISDFKDFKTRIDVTGPLEVTTNDIPNIPFANETPIITLRKGERILCDVILGLGKGDNHIKWRPVSTFTFTENKLTEDGRHGGFLIRMKDVGMMSPINILLSGYNKITEAADRENDNIFTKQLIPYNVQIS